MDTIDVTTKYVVTTINIAKSVASQSTVWNPSPDGDRMLVALQVLFAPGHAGLSGVRVLYNGTTVVPWNQPTAFAYGDNERQTFQMGLYLSAPLQIITTNRDTYPHSFQLVAAMQELAPEVAPIATPIPVLAL